MPPWCSPATSPSPPSRPALPSCSPRSAPTATRRPSSPRAASPPSPAPIPPPTSDPARAALTSLRIQQDSPLQNAPAVSTTTTGYVLHPHPCPISHPTSPICAAASTLMSTAAPISHRPIPHFSPHSRPHGTHMRAHTRDRRLARPSAPSIDEMLLEASTEDPRPRGKPQSPRAVIAHHQHPHDSRAQRPALDRRPGLSRCAWASRLARRTADVPNPYFFPPVTGAPMKKGKSGLSASFHAPPRVALTSSQWPADQDLLLLHPSHQALCPHHQLRQSLSLSPPLALPQQWSPHHTPYPPTNAQGQRICRQCGLVGRYKDGKCVEKWGPGPEGPSTVCDRCRKKMKCVDRRGTMESQNQSQAHIGQQPSQAVVASLVHAHSIPSQVNHVTRTDTIPVTVGIGLGTQLTIGHASQMPSFISKDRRDHDRIPTSLLAPSPAHPSRSGDSQREPPSLPAIATLQADDDKPYRRPSADRGRRPMSSGKIY